MSRKTKKTVIKDEPKFKGSSLKRSQHIPKPDYWLAQSVLDDNAYYSVPEMLEMLETKRNERGI